MDKLKPLVASWLRSYIAAALAVYMSGGNYAAFGVQSK